MHGDYPTGFFFFKQIFELQSQRANNLRYEPKAKEVQAGIDNFNRYGSFNSINALASGDLLRWVSIMNMPYSWVYTKMLMNKTEGEYKENLAELMKPKNEQQP